jgi:recombination protein RecT
VSEQQSTELALPDQVRGDLERQRDQLARLLSNTIPVDRFIAVAYDIAKSPQLSRAHPASVMKAIWDAANLGLEPSGILGEGYLVTRWNKDLQAHEAQFQPGYRGLAQLARRSGHIVALDWGVVFEEDSFEWAEGTTPWIDHRPARDRAETSRPTHAYAWARDINTQVYIAVLDRAEIEHIRSKSPAKNNGPWVTDWGEMAKKSAVRRLCKKLPLSPEIQRAVALDDAAELAEPVEDNGEQPRGTDRLRAALGVRPKAAAIETPAEDGDGGTPPAVVASSQPAEDPAESERPESPVRDATAAMTSPPESPEVEPPAVEAAAVAAPAGIRCPHPSSALHATASGVRCELCDTIVADRSDEPAKPKKARAGKAQALRTGTGSKGIVKEKAESTRAFQKRGAVAGYEEQQQQTAADLFAAGMAAEAEAPSEPLPPAEPKPPQWSGTVFDPFQLAEHDETHVRFVVTLDAHEGTPGGKAQVVTTYGAMPDGLAAKSHVRLGGRLEMVPWADAPEKPPYRRIHAESVEVVS